MQVLTEVRSMQDWADAERAAGHRIALVPTMGGLHAGHAALMRAARARAGRAVVSIFVNPIQFDRRDDFERYPRTLDEDQALCASEGVDVIFVPSAAVMYPKGFHSAVEVGRLTEPLCGRQRPGHFRGVTTVVTKLFHCVRPHLAVFGEKDYQQLAVVRRMTADLDFGIEIVGVPTVRAPDGLALSSRNRRLTAAEREAARCVPQALAAAQAAVRDGEIHAATIAARAAAVIAGEPLARLEYAEIRDPETLDEVAEVSTPALLALAVWVGSVRLIDNQMLGGRARERSSRPTGSGGIGSAQRGGAARALDGPPDETGGRARERSSRPPG
jgi:pantoate--beta-alanine ligase